MKKLALKIDTGFKKPKRLNVAKLSKGAAAIASQSMNNLKKIKPLKKGK